MRAVAIGLMLFVGCGKKSADRDANENHSSVSRPSTKEIPSSKPPDSQPVAQSPQPDPPKIAAIVTAIDLFQEYLKNPAAADAKYKGKLIEVSGSGKVKLSKDGGYYFGFLTVAMPGMTNAQISRLSPREKEWFRAGEYPPNVVGYLSKDGEADAATLGNASQVIVVGTVRGARKADVWKDLAVILENCRVSPKPR